MAKLKFVTDLYKPPILFRAWLNLFISPLPIFYNAISKTYFNLFSGEGASDENEVLSCGLHRSKEVPSTFCESGIEKLLKDFNFFRSITDDKKISVPKSVEHQYMWSLKYFLDDVKTYDKDKDNEKLILPTWHKEFMDRYKKNINKIPSTKEFLWWKILLS